MKKILGIIFLGLLWPKISYSEVIHLKCEYLKIINYSPFKDKSVESEKKLSPPKEHVFSIDLVNETIIGSNYEIWKDRKPIPIQVFDDQIVIVQVSLPDQVHEILIKTYWEQIPFSFYNYTKINRFQGVIEHSKYSQDAETAIKMNDKYFNVLENIEKRKEGLKFIHKLNSIAKNSLKNKSQNNNILISKLTGNCEKLKKLEKKF